MPIGEFGAPPQWGAGNSPVLSTGLYWLYETSHAALNPARAFADVSRLYFKNPVCAGASFTALGVPVAIEGPAALATTPFGHALFLSLLRFAWRDGDRPELYAHLRSPYSGLQRRDVDWIEGRLRGRGISRGERAAEATVELRDGRSLPPLDLVHEDGPPSERRPQARCRDAPQRARDGGAAAGLPARGAISRPTRPWTRVARRAGDARGRGGQRPVTRLDVLVSPRASDGARRPGRLAGQGRRARSHAGPHQAVDTPRARAGAGQTAAAASRRAVPRRRCPPVARRAARSPPRPARRCEPRSLPVRDRRLASAAAARPRSSGRRGRGDAARAQPVLGVGAGAVRPRTTCVGRRPPPALGIHLDIESAPTERERLRALAGVASRAPREAAALARENGWDRRLDRATRAFDRPTRLTHERALQLVGSREAYSVSELERMASCSSAWFVERYLRPATIDKEIDRMMRGSILHSALQRFYQQLPSAVPGADRVTAGERRGCRQRSCATASPRRWRPAFASMPATSGDASSSRGSSAISSSSCATRRPPSRRSCPVISRCRSGLRARARRGRERKDRPCRRRPDGCAGHRVDYKSGAAASAADIRERDLLQLPLYMLVLREQLGLEPVGGLYMPVGGGRRPRGILRSGPDGVPGYSARDYLDPEAFDESMDTARGTAVGLVERIRVGESGTTAGRRLSPLVRSLAHVPH